MLSSIAIPFVAHTCSKTAHTDVTFLSKKAFCHHDEQNSCHSGAEESISKEACCFSLEGVIDADAELVLSQIHSFEGIIAAVKLDIIPKVVLPKKQISSNYYPIAVDKMKQVPLQILQQSFLC